MEEKHSPIDKVYYAFYTTKKSRMYFNEIKDKTKMSISSLQNTLLKLKKLNNIVKYTEKANTFYSLKPNNTKVLLFTKFDLQKLDSLNTEVKVPLKEFIASLDKLKFALLFGSTSRKEEKEESDIDLLVVLYKFKNTSLNDSYKKEIRENIEFYRKKVNSRSLHPINTVFVDEEEFKNKKDYLLEEAKTTGFCVHNQQIYYKEAFENESSRINE